MDDQKNESAEQIDTAKDKLRNKVCRYAKALLIIALTLSGYAFRNALNPLTIYQSFLAEPTIKYKLAKYNGDGIVSYSGELINESATHAKELALKGKFDSKIIDFVISASDSIEKKKINNPDGSVELILKRLSGKNKCQFDIVVFPQTEIVDPIKASWGEKGGLTLIPQKSDDNMARGIELGGKLSDLSRRARQKRFESNTKNIRK